MKRSLALLGFVLVQALAVGQVAMIEFKKAQTPVGPPMEMRIDRDELVKEIPTKRCSCCMG